MRRYDVVSHTADVGFIAYGATPAEMFEHAAFAMFDLVFDLTGAVGRVSRPIVAAGDSLQDLLVAWLSEVLTESEIHDLAFSSFGVDRLEDGGVQGWAAGDPVDRFELKGAPVKAVTHHDLAVVEVPDGWWARVVLDV